MTKELKHSCAVFSTFGPRDSSRLAHLGLYSLQHRGQESTGIVSSDGKQFFSHKAMGLVSDVYTPSVLNQLPGHLATGHNRYSTTGSTRIENAQPMIVDYRKGKLAIAHNGNIVNAAGLRNELERQGSVFQTTMDTEVILHLVARSKEKTLPAMILEALSCVRGAYSLAIMTENQIFAGRDPFGFRPLTLGSVRSNPVVASESCAFDIIGGRLVREIEPGELLLIDKNGQKSFRISRSVEQARCIFELIYFSRPDSIVFGECVDTVRRNLGRTLASEAPAPCDIVIAVPDSSNSAALGFSEEASIKFELGLIRNHYVGRTFIHPKQKLRDLGVRVKYNAVRDILRGKRVAIVDDSVVRGTTSKKLIRMVRMAGAREVHFRVASPQIIDPCFYGIDTPRRSELIARNLSMKELASFIGVDSMEYLSLEGLRNSVREPDKYCYACFTGDYPVTPPKEFDKFSLETAGRRKGASVPSRK
ncbi:MAG: amidophosphoribosyltransferase [Candidatus Eisenbacteria bacterium]|nr:amidophosphoribosyltransferase [Candidatus Eisenbacteria bacterium]